MLLALETALRPGAVALAGADGTIDSQALTDDGNASAALAHVVDRLLLGDVSRVDAYAISAGPGSFTGLRVGFAFLKGLAAVHPRPVVSVSTLEVLAHSTLGQVAPSMVLALIEARRGYVYAGLYAPLSQGLTVSSLLPDGCYEVAEVIEKTRDLPAVCLAGEVELSGCSQVRSHVAPSCEALARTLAQLAGRAGLRGAEDAARIEPLYLEPSAAEAKNMRGR